VFYSDGGGKRRAALNPIYGRDKILRFIIGVTTKGRGLSDQATIRRATINGLPGFVVHGPEGVETYALEISDEHIVAIYAIRNPTSCATSSSATHIRGVPLTTRADRDPTRTVFLNVRGSTTVQSEYGFFVADFPVEVIQ